MATTPEEWSAGADTGVSRTTGTLGQYRARGVQLLSRYRELMELGLDHPADPGGFVSWLADLRPGLRPATWRLYRQAALYLLDGWPDINLDKAHSELNEAVTPTVKPPPRTSARKLRRIPVDDYRRLCRHLMRRDATRAALDTRDLLVAGLVTGLRPGEWRTAEVVEVRGRTWLLIRERLKTTNGRGLGSEAALDISELAAKDRRAVARMAARGRAWHATGEYGRRQEACGQLLRDACRALWPQRRRMFSLYSARHQATAAFKAILAPEEIAAIVGHAVTRTMVGYGRRASAWPVDAVPPPPRPAPALVAAVRRSAGTTRPRGIPKPGRVTPHVTQDLR